MKKYCMLFVCAALSCCIALPAMSATATATPAVYQITLQDVQLYNSTTGSWFPVASGDVAFNIAQANAGEAVGAYIANANLPEGTYTQVMFRVSRTIAVQAQAVIGATTYYTTAAQFNNFGLSADKGKAILVSSAVSGSVEGNFIVPGDAPSSIPSGYSHTVYAAYFEGVVTSPSFVPFTYVPGQSKRIRLSFDVTNAVVFDDATFGTPVCYINPPVVSVSIE